MLILYIAAYFFCVFDYICTQYWVNKFGAEIEINRFGRWLFGVWDGALAFLVKIVFSFGLLALLYQFRETSLCKIGIWVIFLVYLVIAIYHIIILIKVNNL